MKGRTHYSEKVKGAPGNYGWPVRFDVTDGYLGVSQSCDAPDPTNRVLLSPKQVTELVVFYRCHGSTKRHADPKRTLAAKRKAKARRARNQRA